MQCPTSSCPISLCVFLDVSSLFFFFFMRAHEGCDWGKEFLQMWFWVNKPPPPPRSRQIFFVWTSNSILVILKFWKWAWEFCSLKRCQPLPLAPLHQVPLKFKSQCSLEFPLCAGEMNLTSIHEDVGLIPGLDRGSGIQCFNELWCRLQTQLRCCVAVAVAVAGSCSSDFTPIRGTSMGAPPPKKKAKKKNNNKKESMQSEWCSGPRLWTCAQNLPRIRNLALLAGFLVLVPVLKGVYIIFFF